VIFLVLWGMALPGFCGLSITVIYDNSLYKEGIAEDWGFSCLIKAGRKEILFDTGQEGNILLSNADKLGVDLKTIDCIVLSHLHQDHSGGLRDVLKIQPSVKVFLPELTPEFQQMFAQYGPGSNVIVKKPMQIIKGVFLTGAMGKGLSEQALIINTSSGLIIIVGCSHPGVTHIISRAREMINKPVYLVMGGFHSMPKTPEGMFRVIQKLKSLGVRRVAPAHCTEEKIKNAFKAVYGKNYIAVGAGRTLNFSRKKK